MAIRGLTGLINMGDIVEGTDLSRESQFAPPSDPMPGAGDLRQDRRPVPQKSRAALIQPAPAPQAPAPQTRRSGMPDRIFTTGRMRVGKDFVLNKLGYVQNGLADPLYVLQKLFFGTDDKSAPGARQFLQTVGQWGRGTVNEKYPLSVGRAVFCTMVRTMAAQLPKDHQVDWTQYGLSDGLWLDALIRRLSGVSGKQAITNCRFPNEFKALIDDGFVHFHVMCSKETWMRRLSQVGLSPTSPAVMDTSEEQAAFLDGDVQKSVNLKPNGPKLRVIWNDEQVPPPSPRFYTLDELKG